MSGGKSRSRTRASGWEEAGGEFYQELYPGGEQDVFENLQRADVNALHTLLPSKHARTTTVKRARSQNERRQSTFARTTQSRDITLSMLPDLSENLSNEERTWEEIMQIKAMPLPMHQKRELKARLQNATKLRLQGLEQFHWRQRKVWHQFTIRFSEIIGKLVLWQSSMRDIEGTFGIGVVSFFLFLRWLLFLNIGISTLIILFLIIPKTMLVENDFSNATTCSQAYFNKNLTDSNVFLDILQGTGWMERTLLFYGVYSKKIYKYKINMFQADMYYNMPLTYVLILLTWALVSLVAIVKSAAKGFKERLVEREGQFYLYCNLVFGGWDFCIHNEKSAKVKHKALFNEFKGGIEEERFKEEIQLRTKESQIFLHLKRIVINLIVLTILCACAFFIYIVFNYSSEKLNSENKHDESTKLNGTLKLTLSHYKQGVYSFGQLENTLLEFLPSICIVVLNLLVPEIFGFLIKFENFSPSRVILVTLLRTVSLRLSSLAVLITQMYSLIKSSESVCSLNSNDGSKLECWETYVGQQLYKLVVTDFALQFFTTFFINLPRSLIGKHSNSRCLRMFGCQDFYLPKQVLDIVYIQTVIWIGSFYCPFLPIMGTIYYILVFYIKKFTCLVNCTPSPVVYKASKSKSLFMSVLLLSLIVSMIPVGYSIAELLPSLNCGPFRGVETVWTYVIITFEGFPYMVREGVFLIGTSTFAVPAFALILFFLYYYWAVATANRHMVAVLKNQLVLEGHDKQFLLNRLSAFIRQHQKRCERKKENRASFVDDESIRQSSR